MMFASLMALAGAAVVDHERSAYHQTKGSGPGLVPLRTRPCTWGKGGVYPPPSPLKLLLTHHLGPAVPHTSYLGCPGLSWAVLC